MTDFIIVGRGLAATTLAHTFHKNNISFIMIGDTELSNCSKVAAGIWNPVVFKRLTKSWLADELILCLNTFYTACETLLQKKIITQRNIVKPFTEEQEKTLWLKKANTELNAFLDPNLESKPRPDLEHFEIVNGYGTLMQCGNLNVPLFLEESTRFFKEQIADEVVDYTQLKILEDKVEYKEVSAKNIIFCEGHLVKNNYLFNWIPLKPAKGEILSITAPELRLKDLIFNRNGFLMDVEDGGYKVGATYAWDDFSEQTTEKALEELKGKVYKMINCGYTVTKHEAGIRPSSIDRRPIIGAHPLHKNAFVINGLGTKGVMLAPYFIKNFVNFYLKKQPLHGEVNVSRFYHLYEGKK